MGDAGECRHPSSRQIFEATCGIRVRVRESRT